MKDYRMKFEDSNHILLDVFTGADNDAFWTYLSNMRKIAEMANNGDSAAEKICETVNQMARLVMMFKN